MEKWPLKSPESKFSKKPMLLHIIFAWLSDETLGLKIYRASFLISIVQSKKKSYLNFLVKVFYSSSFFDGFWFLIRLTMSGHKDRASWSLSQSYRFFKKPFQQWLQTEIKPRFCKTSENYFSGCHLKVQVKLPLKIEKWGSTYIGSRGYD